MIICYHGCPQNVIETLVSGKIDISLGGGELGRGFYSTLDLWVAKRWALSNYQSETVLKIEISDESFDDLDSLILSKSQVQYYRKLIKKLKETRTYQFHRNIIYSPIVGDRMADKNVFQLKWESKMAERLLNSDAVRRSKI